MVAILNEDAEREADQKKVSKMKRRAVMERRQRKREKKLQAMMKARQQYLMTKAMQAKTVDDDTETDKS